MQKHLFVIFLVTLTFIGLNSQDIDFHPWTLIRTTSPSATGNFKLRCETVSLPGSEVRVKYFDGQSVVTTPMQNISGVTYEVELNCIFTDSLNLYFSTIGETLSVAQIAPAFNTGNPIDNWNYLGSDPSGDNTDGTANQDITEQYFGETATDFMCVMGNASGQFPLSGGGLIPSEFYAYIAAIINPEAVISDTTIYGMVYCNVPILFSPGLYKISGIDITDLTNLGLDNFSRIGDIQSNIVDGKLVMSCDKTLLTSDENFGDWPNLSNALAVSFLTPIVSLQGSFSLGDYGSLSGVSFSKATIHNSQNTIPEISYRFNFDNDPQLEVDYYDADGHFPLVAEFEACYADTTQNQVYSLVSDAIIFSDTILFTAANLDLTNSADLLSGKIRISDNGEDFVEETIMFNGVSVKETPPINADLQVNLYPNPVSAAEGVNVSYSLPQASNIEVSIFNIKGQKVKQLVSQLQPKGSYNVVWNGKSDSNTDVGSGIYFCKIKSKYAFNIKKIMFIK